jgi:hypothetical protein
VTISLRVAGAATSATAAVTAVSPAVGAGATTGDLSILVVAAKPYNTAITTPSGWTKIGEGTNGTTASGIDTGSTIVAVYYKLDAATGAIGNITQSGASSMVGQITTYSTDAPGWDVSASTVGGDTSDGANYSATGAAGINVATGDRVYVGTSINSDAGTLSAASVAGMSGATVTDHQGRSSQAVTTGDDMRLYVRDVLISAGSSSAAPLFTFTNASSTSGTSFFLRLRDNAGRAASLTWTAATSAEGSGGASPSVSTAFAVSADGVVAKSTDSTVALTAAVTAVGSVNLGTGGGGSTTYRAFDTASPNDTGNPDAGLALGFEFHVLVDATCTRVGWWQPSTGTVDTGVRTLVLYQANSGSSGTELARATMTPTGGGLQMATFASPVALTANQAYRAVTHHSNGGYPFTAHYFDSVPYDTGNVTVGGVLVIRNNLNTQDFDQGSFIYGGVNYPDGSFNSANYWTDVEVVVAGGGSPSEALVDTVFGVSAAGAVTSPSGSDLTFTANVFSAGVVGTSRTSTVATTAGVSAAGGTLGAAALSWTAAVTAAGTVTLGKASGAARATTFAVAADGVANSTRSSTVATTAAVTAAGISGAGAVASVATTASVVSAGVVGQPNSQLLTFTAAVTATGVAASATGAAVAAAATVTADGHLGAAPGAADVAVVAAIAADGVAGSTSGAALTVTATVVAAGELTGTLNSADLQATFAVVAAGAVGTNRGAAVAVSVAVIADGQVSFTVAYAGPKLTVGNPAGSQWRVGRARGSLWATTGATNIGLARSADPEPVTRGNP